MFLILLFLITVFIIYLSWSPPPNISPKGKVILVTGSASGVGQSVVEYLLAKECFIYAMDLNQSRLEEIYEKNENVKIIPCDVTKRDQVDNAFEIVKKEGRGLFGIVNSAGILFASEGRTVGVAKATSELTIETEAKPVFEVNLWGSLHIIQAFIPLLIESKGSIVNISSISARTGIFGNSPYGMSKAAISGLTHQLRIELKPFDVRVFAIEPHIVDTPMTFKYHTSVPRVDFSQTQYLNFFKKLDGLRQKLDPKTFIKPLQVAQQVHDCLFTSNLAQYRFMIAPQAALYHLLGILPYGVNDVIVEKLLV